MEHWYDLYENDPGIRYHREEIEKQTAQWIKHVKGIVMDCETWHKIPVIFEVDKTDIGCLHRLLETVKVEWDCYSDTMGNVLSKDAITQFQRFSCRYKYWTEYCMDNPQMGFVPLEDNPIEKKDHVKIVRPKGHHRYGS